MVLDVLKLNYLIIFSSALFIVNNLMPLFKVSNIYSASAEYIRIQENP